MDEHESGPARQYSEDPNEGPDQELMVDGVTPVESGARSQALLNALHAARRERAAAEAREAELMLAVDHARTVEASRHIDPRLQALEAASAVDDMSLDLALPAGTIAAKLAELHLVRGQLPGIWQRHQQGSLDSWRVHVIAEMAARVQDPANLTVLDERLSAWLDEQARTPGQLRAKLRRLIAHLEPEAQSERQRDVWAERRAAVQHDEDGTALLCSTLSAADGIAVQDMVDQLARQRAHTTHSGSRSSRRAPILWPTSYWVASTTTVRRRALRGWPRVSASSCPSPRWPDSTTSPG